MTRYNGPASEIVLLFETGTLDNVIDQLGKELDRHHVAGQPQTMPTLILVRKRVWLQLEREFQKKKIANREPYALANDVMERTDAPAKSSYNALIFRARPVVAIDGANIVADRVGAND